MTTVAIAGGGLAGLVAARHLAEAGFDVQLFERDPAFGGRVRSIEKDGFVLDRGFQVLLTEYPAAQRELDYDALDLKQFPPGVVLAAPNSRMTLGDPLRDLSALSQAIFSRAMTTRDKLLALKLRRQLARTPEDQLLDDDSQTIRDGLSELGFSARFIDGLAAPLYGGITLDRSLSTSMGVFNYTFEKFSAGHAAVPATGMQAIPDQLAERAREAGATLHLNTRVETISETEDDTDGRGNRARRPSTDEPLWKRETLIEHGDSRTGGAITVDLGRETVAVDAVVVATDPATARELTGVDSISVGSRGCITQYYSLPASRELPTDGQLVLNAGGTEPNHVVAHSQIAPGHAPVGQTLLSATFLGTPDEPDSALAGKTQAALSAWFPEMVFDDLEPIHTERIPFAQLHQPPGFRAQRPDPREPDGPVVLAGDYTRWSSIQGALESGRQAAWAVEAELEG